VLLLHRNVIDDNFHIRHGPGIDVLDDYKATHDDGIDIRISVDDQHWAQHSM
jgi:hypothetical protein